MDYKRANEVLDAAIRRLMTERGLSYPAAAEVIQREQPKLWQARQVVWVQEYRKRERAKLDKPTTVQEIKR